jgi:hypothetical protein
MGHDKRFLFAQKKCDDIHAVSSYINGQSTVRTIHTCSSDPSGTPSSMASGVLARLRLMVSPPLVDSRAPQA